jgi:hypothetical protein
MDNREVLQSLNLAHKNLLNKQYKNARMQIGLMIRLLEKEFEQEVLPKECRHDYSNGDHVRDRCKHCNKLIGY